MLHSLSRPVLLALLLTVFAAGCTAYAALKPETPTTPSGEELFPASGEWAHQRLSELTLDQKISQLFSARAYSHYTSIDDPAYQDLVDMVERFEIGGISFFQGQPMAQATLVNDLQRRARTPLLIAQDMEWGAGMRIERTTTFPRTMAIGASRDPRLAYAAGFVTAQEARALGTHQVLAPVADVNNNPYNPIINVRSFGEDPALVAEMATAMARGLMDGGTIATAKHFPGHGDTAVDSHADLPILPFGRDRLDRLELIPFRELIDDGIMSVMTGHLAFPQVEPDSTVPATLSAGVSTAILRNDLGFQGLVVTDALDMAGVTKNFSTGEIAVRALEAGADMLLLSEDPDAAHAAIRQAIESGRLSEKRIDDAVLRVLRAKEWLGLHENPMVEIDAVRRDVATARNLAISATIARRSLTLLRNENDLVPLLDERPRILNVTLSDSDDPSEGSFFVNRLRAEADEAVVVASRRLDTRSDERAYENVLREAAQYDVIVVPAFIYVRSWSGRINLPDRHQSFLNKLIAAGKPVVLVSFGNPYIPIGLEPPDTYIAAYGASEASQEAVAEALFGRSGFEGRLPISIPGLYEIGDGIIVEPARLRAGIGDEAGLDERKLRRVDSLMLAAIKRGAFPGSAVAIGRGGVVARLRAYGYHTYESRQRVTPRSLFDLASLTKVVATTTAAMKLHDEGRLKLDDPVGKYLPEFAQNGKQEVTIRHLLTHSAGLIPFRPFHTLGVTTREALIQAVMAEKLEYRPGTQSRYSDLGLITLSLVVERISGKPFDVYAKEEIFRPLGMHRTGFRGVGATDLTVVPTEVDRLFRNRLIQGEVHDEAAWILGGTSGHAGVFSTAEDLAKFAYMLVHGGRVDGRQFISSETIRLFTTPAEPGKHTRALGWDTRPPEGYSSAGRFFGPRSFGHTGFTGTSLWIDPDQQLFVILLSNRVYPTRENLKITQVRAELADLAYESIVGPVGTLLPVRPPR